MPPTTDQIPLSAAQALVTASAQALEETRTSRKETREELRDLSRDISDLQTAVSSLRVEIAPALEAHASYVKGLETAHHANIVRVVEARSTFVASVASAATSRAAIALYGALATALAAVLARYLGAA